MKLVKKTAEYSVYLRRDGRHAVRGSNGKWVNGDDKVEILYKEELLKKPEPKAEEPEEVSEETGESEEAAE
jgi:hypothetical protein